MKMKFITVFLILFCKLLICQPPFYYKFKRIHGSILDIDSNKIDIEFKSRHSLLIKNCSKADIDTLLRTLTFTRLSRKYLQHLITTSSVITIDVSENIGLQRKDGKYRLIAGIAMNKKGHSNKLITDNTSNFYSPQKAPLLNKVYKENSITFFKGSLYFYNKSMDANNSNVTIINAINGETTTAINMDTINIEPISHADLMYKNIKEVYYFVGIHEIYHTTAMNIAKQIKKIDSESDAYLIERKAFKKRKKINKMKINRK